jgi:hypothetical protein
MSRDTWELCPGTRHSSAHQKSPGHTSELRLFENRRSHRSLAVASAGGKGNQAIVVPEPFGQVDRSTDVEDLVFRKRPVAVDPGRGQPIESVGEHKSWIAARISRFSDAM